MGHSFLQSVLNSFHIHLQFLISPPSSPPIGWEPVEEDPPVINQELLDALANIDKLVNREILAAQDNTPAINVCDCSDTPPVRCCCNSTLLFSNPHLSTLFLLWVQSEDQLPAPPQPGNLAAFGASRGMAGRGQMPSAPAWLQNTQHTIHGWLQPLSPLIAPPSSHNPPPPSSLPNTTRGAWSTRLAGAMWRGLCNYQDASAAAVVAPTATRSLVCGAAAGEVEAEACVERRLLAHNEARCRSNLLDRTAANGVRFGDDLGGGLANKRQPKQHVSAVRTKTNRFIGILSVMYLTWCSGMPSTIAGG